MILAAVFLMTACSTKNEDRSPDAVTHNVFVTHPTGTGSGESISLSATVEEGRTISVGFKTAGQIERIYVKEGDRVSQGQLIARLDSKDYNLGVSILREKFANLQTETERQRQLHASGNMSDNDFEKAVSGLHQLELQLELEESKLSYCSLYAPASGIVTKVNFENSEMVDAGTPVIELMDNSALEAVVDLPVRIYALRNSFSEFIGESAVDPGRQIALTMLSLTPRADNTQLYRLRLAVPTNSGLTPGMNLKVKIICTGSGRDTVEVPLSSVFERNGHKYVWKVNPADSVISPVEVIPQSTGEGGTLSVSGQLTPSDIIVRAGVNHLSDNEKVAIITENSPSNPGNIL